MMNTDGRLWVARRVAATVAVVALIVALAATPAVVAAAGTTDVVFDDADASLAAGEETTVPVVVTNADGGVGAYNVTVAVDDPNVAQIADVELAGDPGLAELRTADDGSRVTVRAALADTDDEGEVTLLRVTLVGEAAGTTDVSLSVATLGDEEGRPYTVADTAGTTITVDADATTTPADGTATPGGDGSDDEGSAPDESESESAGDDSSTGSDGDTQDGDTQSDTVTTATPTSTPEPSNSTTTTDSTGDGAETEATQTPTETPTADPSPTGTEQSTESAARTGLASPMAERSDEILPASPLTLTISAVGLLALIAGVGYLRGRR